MNMHPEIQRAMPSARRAAREVPATRHIPFVRFLEDGTFTTRNGDLVAVLELDGFIHETAAREEIKAANKTLARLAASFEDNRTAFYSHITRTRIQLSDTLPPVSGPAFSAELDRHYRAQLDQAETYRLRHFLTIVRRPYSTGKRLLDAGLRSFRTNTTNPAETATRAKNREALHMAAEQAARDLSTFGARRLKGSAADRSRTLSFLSMLQSGIWQPAPAVWTHLADAVPNGRITFHKTHVESRSPGGDQDRFAAVFAINAYGAESKHYMFDDLLGERCEFIATQSYAPVDRVTGGTKIKDAKRGMQDAGDEAETLQKDLNDARDAVASRAMSVGRHHFTVAVLGETRAAMEDAATRVNSALTGADMRTRREDIGLEAAWWAQLPGNFGYQTRSKKRFVSDENFADFANLHSWPTGSREKLRWGGPVAAFRTLGGTPYWFSFHREGSDKSKGPGTTAIFGATGEGKTLFANFLMSSCYRLPATPHLIAFDKDRGSETFIRAIGGTYLQLKPGMNLGFNPFAVATEEVGLEWLEGFIHRLTGAEKLTPEQERRIAIGLRRLADGDPSLRTFSDFAATLRSVDDADAPIQLLDALSKWFGNGNRAWLFDNPQDSFSLDQAVSCFDMTALLKASDIRLPLLDYLFYRIERKLAEGKPLIIMVDEAWALFDDPRFGPRIQDWIKTIRKLDGILVFMTQETSDAAKSSISNTLIQSTENRIFFANPKADRATYVDAFRLTEAEFSAILSMPPKSRLALISDGDGSAVVSTRLDLPEPFYRVLSSTGDSIASMDRLRAEYGENGWLTPFLTPDASEETPR
ncbi:hypothetical protein RA27_22390 [Ruegeria sp. ANG-R]|uniref:VirB4 family type IV secretion/conjugal transfer ATPase n=1 Tax=Ruegeria sp. ANG-R TaxID=1577903 RepID=UPI00057E8F91|nr:hypothetical protein [Ruegeria sp. ANG-R]KIC36094.1 hypothetical protein RA27_22390 [Ruegeria sp. ANG-R]